MFRTFLIVAFAISLTSVGSLSRDAEAKRPNVVLFLADDLGYETLGCDGSDSYKSPNLDKLAAGGIRFDRCQVQPVCTPTRVQLMTGLSNARNYIDFGNMDRKAVTFGNLFKDAGYATCMAGKWQLGREKDLPQKFGFDEAFLWQHMRRPPRYANPGLELNGEEKDYKNGEYGPKLINDFALDFIEKNKDKPFFLYYTEMLTHDPWQPTPDSKDWNPEKFTTEEKGGPQYFGDDVAYMDKNVGRVIAKLDELGIRDNTLFLFLGDNGTGVGNTSKWKGQKYPGGKGKTNARGMHVPLIVSWPGHTPAGKVNDDIVDSTDFLATICEAAGIKVPETSNVDGHSFFPQILGEKGHPREWVYDWYSSPGVAPFHEFVATKQYKLYRDGRFYDLTKDPFEEKEPKKESELNGDEGAAAKKLRAVLTSYGGVRSPELQKESDEINQKKPTRLQKQQRQQKRQAEKKAAAERKATAERKGDSDSKAKSDSK
jgi:arylsulfatase A